MRHAARQAEYGPQGNAVAGSENCPVGDRARQNPQRSMFAAQQIVGEIQSSKHVERAADNADQRECVLIHSQPTPSGKRHGLAVVQYQKRIARGAFAQPLPGRVKALIRQLEGAVVDRYAGPRAQDVMSPDRILGTHVNR
jgi:hypothetical protein